MNETLRMKRLEKENRQLKRENERLKKLLKCDVQEVRHAAMREGFLAAEVWYSKMSHPP